MRQVVPSVLTSDPEDLEKKIRILEQVADVIQIDIMDGEFVPNISIGVGEVQRANPQAQLEIHLMVKHPVKYIQSFARIGAFRIIFHIESDDVAAHVIREIKQFSMQPGIALNPPTPVEKIKPFLDSVGVVLVMGVNPGLQGQKFMPEVLPKIKRLKSLVVSRKLSVDIEVDGGINLETAPQVVKAGANVLVAGSAIFYAQDYQAIIQKLKSL